jgi:high affinity Mn2+ porin
VIFESSIKSEPKMKKLLTGILSILLLQAFGQETELKPSRSTFHFQTTTVTQWVGKFNAAYTGSQSFLPEETKTTLSTTFFIGYRLAKNTELIVNPEIAGGSGVSGVFGMASFPNAEAMRTGQQAPFYYVARAFVRQTIPLTEEKEWVGDGINTLAGYVPTKRLVITVGKMALTDFFDANTYSHDGRTQFFNWSIGTQGAYDFAADNKAYTQGVVVELVNANWKLRYSFAQLSTTANGKYFNWNMASANHQVIEIEKKAYWNDHYPLTVRLMGYKGLNNYGVYTEATSDGSVIPLEDVQTKTHIKYGLGLNVEQPISENSGLFARASWNNGLYQTWSYTEIDQSATIGASFSGHAWKRPTDRFGIAAGANGISKSHREYLRNGGTGILLGDGSLNYGVEQVFETFYSLKFNQNVWITGDYQFCINPGYNKDRGPVWSIIGLRMHAEF